jgi:hypothetical protein
MGQIFPVLSKIKRNLDMMGIPATQSASAVTLTNSSRVISYQLMDLKDPLGGVDPSVSPFLGIKQANPGKLVLKGAAGENTVAAILSDAETARVLAMLGGFANDKVIEAGDSATELAYLEGHETQQGMGQ